MRFRTSSRGARAGTWDDEGSLFKSFRGACRRAIATVGAGRPIL
ncbi:hypothetical protein [Streptomyces sp. NPDC056480]